ncbi:MAG TPA: hypothetical protein DCG12_20695 [Planctomycetaceae bacterium]|nr:hypothetical protein [Planctomycetaceae bacterium]
MSTCKRLDSSIGSGPDAAESLFLTGILSVVPHSSEFKLWRIPLFKFQKHARRSAIGETTGHPIRMRLPVKRICKQAGASDAF